MPFIKVDLDKLKVFSSNLYQWYATAEDNRVGASSIYYLEDPANIAGYFDSNNIMYNRILDLFHLVGSLDTRIANVEAVNQCGVNSSGNPVNGYYLPDGVADTTENVTAYNKRSIDSARNLAAKLDYAVKHDGKSKDGKTVDELVAELAKHQDIPPFGAAFVSSFPTPEDYLNVVEQTCKYYYYTDDLEETGQSRTDIAGRDKALATMSHLLASAAEYGPNNGKDLGNWFGKAIAKNTGVGQAKYIQTMNALLTCTSQTFNTGFLVNLGNNFVDIDPKKLAHPMITDPYHGLTLGKDPMTGVLAAMGPKRNSRAALEFMTQNGNIDDKGNWIPSAETQQRWEKLKNRKSPDAGFQDTFTEAIAGVSTYRNSDDSTSNSRHVKNADARASWLSGEAIRHFVVDFSPGDFTEKMKANLGVVLANSPEEVASVANGATVNDFASGPKLANVSSDQIKFLLYRVIDNSSAATGIGLTTAEFHRKQAQKCLDSGQCTSEDLSKHYKHAAGTMSYLQTLADLRLKDDEQRDKEGLDKRKEAVNKGLGVFATVLAEGIAAVNPAAAGYVAVGSSVGLALAETVNSEAFSKNTKVAGGKGGKPPAHNLLKAQAYSDLAKANLLTPESIEEAKKAGVLYDSSGKPLDLTLDGYTREYVEKTTGWAEHLDSGAVADVERAMNDGQQNAETLVKDEFEAPPPKPGEEDDGLGDFRKERSWKKK